MSMISILCVIFISIILYKAVSFGTEFSFGKKSKFKSLFKFIPNTAGEKITLMSKKCEICGNKTIYLDGDDTSRLKMINIVDPDSGEVVNKLVCDDCYEKFQNIINKEKTNKVKLSKELKELANLIKNS